MRIQRFSEKRIGEMGRGQLDNFVNVGWGEQCLTLGEVRVAATSHC